MRDTIGTLLGKAPSEEFIEEITKSLMEYHYILGIHDLVIHNYGPSRYMASLHAEVPYDVSIMDIHEIIDKAEKEVGAKYNLYLSIHMDPVIINSPEVNELKAKVEEMLKEIKGVLSIHDFRVVGDGEEKTLIFDAVINKSYTLEEQNLVQAQINEAIHGISPKYRSIVTLDREFH